MTPCLSGDMSALLLVVSLAYALATHGLIETTRRFLLSKPPGTRMVGVACDKRNTNCLTYLKKYYDLYIFDFAKYTTIIPKATATTTTITIYISTITNITTAVLRQCMD